ncbi:hypothetical protein C8Q75DRAFT_731900 [Abortiporus biennis]|nr:hypothetical protein C8Q75DRAFT_731900 [Abortiporus biennis]
MPSYDNIDDDDLFSPPSSSSRFLGVASNNGPRKQPSRQTINGRRSTASLRSPSSLAQTLDDDAANGRHSLAHELAVALMPEPSAGSKLLAEEFGIEYDEGAEGIDDQDSPKDTLHSNDFCTAPDPTFDGHPHTPHDDQQPLPPSFSIDATPAFDPAFGSPLAKPPSSPSKVPEQDPMITLADDLAYTEKFLAQLRKLDGDYTGPTSAQPTLEKLASDMIRRIDDSVRDREGQVRELLEYEREFRRIAGEIGGSDVLGQLDELENIIEEPSTTATTSTSKTEDNTQDARNRALDAIQEESLSSSQILANSSDWEAYLDRDRERLGAGAEEDEEYDSSVYSPSPVKAVFTIPPPPPISGPITPASVIPHLAHIRTFTTSVASSLATISEQTQVNAAATTEAGRKIRALKNKMTGWRTEWDSAEKSRMKIEKWEAGIMDGDSTPSSTPGTPTKTTSTIIVSKRVDGRTLVKEHLQAFERALVEANTKTQAIIAAVS